MDPLDQDAINNASPYWALQMARRILPSNLEVDQYQSGDGVLFELTLDRPNGRMILEAYRGGDLLGEPLEIFNARLGDILLGFDWCALNTQQLIQRVLKLENRLLSRTP